MNKTVYIIITLGLVIALGIIFAGKPNQNSSFAEDVKIIDGIQYVTINAKGGYFPNVSKAKADIPSKLIVKTSGTYDCSSALVIKSINYQKILPQNGRTEIDLGTPKSGDIFQGTCSMGMYNFTVEFE